MIWPRHQAESAVTVVVPTIRDPERLERCMRAVLEAGGSDGIELELVVVLDGAEADVVERMESGSPIATVLSWQERRGFAGALNAAVRATESPFVAVIQDDAIPRSGWLRSLLDVAQTHDDVGVVGPLVLGHDGCVRRAGALIGSDGRTADPWLGTPPAPEQFTELQPVDYLSSSSLLIRRSAWEAVGGFDEELYPAVYVDADFCTALWNAGWRVLFEPRSRVVHDPGGSTSERFRHFLYGRNRRRFLAKWGTCFVGRPTFPSGQGDPGSVGQPGRWRTVASERVAPVEDGPAVYLRRERDMLRAYVAELEARLGEDPEAP